MIQNTNQIFIGIDVGTQGVRVCAIDGLGQMLASAEENLPLSENSREEQSPLQWWISCYNLLHKVLGSLPAGYQKDSIKAISVTSTSGTIIPVDKNGQPLHSALMYSDSRSEVEGKICAREASDALQQGYTAFNASSGLSKMVWFINNYPEKLQQLHLFIHAADFIIGRMSNNYSITDETNALKSGYDVFGQQWPDYISTRLPVKRQWLQKVVPSGTAIGNLQPELATQLGLPSGVKVVSGMTDGCASQIAAGAVAPGDWNTTIGTTLVVKGVTGKFLNDPMGRLYCHRHPQGYWMPGGASNTGADWVARWFSSSLETLNKEAGNFIPGNLLAYPLLQQGERFPFVAPQARGWVPGQISDAERFAVCMEGVAYLERYAFEMIEALSGEKVKAIFTAGGGSNNDLWLKIRASVLRKPVIKMKYTSGAIGAAILAASQTAFSSLEEAGRALTRPEKTVLPQPQWMSAYERNYQLFKQTLKEKGYIEDAYA